jgi:hypothetical protein
MGMQGYTRKLRKVMHSQRVGGGADYILPLGLVALAGIGLWMLFKNGNPLASSANSENNKQIDQQTTSTLQTAYTASAGSVPQSLQDTELNAMATTIYTDGLSGDTADIVMQLSNVNNITDLYRLMQLFGTKQAAATFWSTCNLMGFNCQSLDLASYVHTVVSSDQLTQINQNFSGNGINYQF